MDPQEAPLVFETPGGLSVRYRGRQLYSGREPSRLPLRTAAACDTGPSRIHLAFSPLLWYGVPELLARMGSGSVILCVEADPALAALARRVAPAGLLDDSRVHFIETLSPAALVSKALSLGSFRACAAIALSGGEALHAQLYSAMTAALSSELETRWRNRAALVVMGRLWAKNIFDNIAALPGIEPRPFALLPAVPLVCGAGPSLEEVIPFIAEERGRLSVLACDTALGSLLASGIVPDLVVCLEAQAHNLADFTPLGDRAVALSADISSHPATFRAVRGEKHLTIARLAESPLLDRIAALGLPLLPMPPLGSVGVHALRLARSLAPDGAPVLVAGLDFCFETGKTHARGSPTLLAEELRMRRLRRWNGQYEASFRERSVPAHCPPTPSGHDLLSDPTLLSYAALLRAQAAESGPSLVDLRGRGPPIGAAASGRDAARAAIDAWERSRPASCPAAPGRSASLSGRELAGRAAAFLGAEAARLDALHDLLKGKGETGGLGRAVAECDWVYWSWPDADRARELPQDFLNRLLPELRYWSWRLARAAAPLA